MLQRQNKEYNEFCDTNNFKKRDDRITVAQWDRHQASMARVAAKRGEKAEFERKLQIMYNKQKARETIGTEELPLKVHKWRQNKHIKGTREYQIGKKLFNNQF